MSIARLRVELEMARRAIRQHRHAERELERILAGLVDIAEHKPRCKCDAAKALRDFGAESRSHNHSKPNRP